MINFLRAIGRWIHALRRRSRHGRGARGSIDLRGARAVRRPGKRRKRP